MRGEGIKLLRVQGLDNKAVEAGVGVMWRAVQDWFYSKAAASN